MITIISLIADSSPVVDVCTLGRYGRRVNKHTSIYDAIEIRGQNGANIIVEVQHDIGENIVCTVAMGQH